MYIRPHSQDNISKSLWPKDVVIQMLRRGWWVFGRSLLGISKITKGTDITTWIKSKVNTTCIHLTNWRVIVMESTLRCTCLQLCTVLDNIILCFLQFFCLVSQQEKKDKQIQFFIMLHEWLFSRMITYLYYTYMAITIFEIYALFSWGKKKTYMNTLKQTMNLISIPKKQ